LRAGTTTAIQFGCQDKDLRVQFDGRLKLNFLGSRVTTDAGLLACRELDEAFAPSTRTRERRSPTKELLGL